MIRGVLSAWFVALGCLAWSCGSTQETTSSGSSDAVLVGLERTPCHGRCPVYSLRVLSDGRATLDVGRFCDEAFGRSLSQGRHTAQVDVGIWGLVADEARAMGFDTLAARYDDPRVMDLPSTTLTIHDWSVMNRYGGPNLNELYTRIERLVGRMDWQATAEDAR